MGGRRAGRAAAAAILLVGLAAVLFVPLAGSVAAPSFQFADGADTSAAAFTLTADSAGVAADTAVVRRNGTTDTTLLLGGDNQFDSAVTLATGRHQFTIVPSLPADSTLAQDQASTATIYYADSPTTVTLDSPSSLSGVGSVQTALSITQVQRTQTFGGRIFDVGIDTPSTVRFRVLNNTGTAVVDSTVAVDSAATGTWAGPITFGSDSVGSNTVTISATDAAAPFFGDTKIVVVTLSSDVPAGGVSIQSITNEGDTSYAIDPVESTGGNESFAQIVLDSGGSRLFDSTHATFQSFANATGGGANHRAAVGLNGGDSATVYVWTGSETLSLLAATHAPVAQGSNYTTGHLPTGVEGNSSFLTAFDATVISLEFADANGNLFGDSRTSATLADTLSYTVCWTLRDTTARLFATALVDTTTNSSAFRLWTADSIGGRWIQDTLVSSVGVVSSGETLLVCAVGITHATHLGLAGSSGAGALSGGGSCLLERAGVPAAALRPLRAWRDRALATRPGRALAAIYYRLTR